MTRTKPLADLYANHCMDAPAPNAHSRVVTLEVTVVARAPGATRLSPTKIRSGTAELKTSATRPQSVQRAGTVDT